VTILPLSGGRSGLIFEFVDMALVQTL